MERGKFRQVILSEREIKWIQTHFKNTKNCEIALKLGISESTLHRIAREYGLKKTPQFMKKCQAYTTQCADESHRRNGTYPPKGYLIPGREKGCFKKGESNKDRLSPKKFKIMQEKREASWKATYKADRARFAFGLEQKTKFRYVRQSSSKTSYRHNMKKKGYIVGLDRNVFYYTSEEMRHPIAERNATRYGIRIDSIINRI